MITPKHWPYRKPDTVSAQPANPPPPRPPVGGAVSPSDGDATPSQHGNRTLLTTGEAAHVLRLSPRTLERFRVEGTGPRYVKAGPGKRARVLYRKEDLEAWLDGFRFTSTSEYIG